MSLQDMPPVTDAHHQQAHAALKLVPTFIAVMTRPEFALMRRCVEAKAHQIRTAEWLATQQRTVIAVKRCRPGVDGHPVKWATQLAMGPYEPRTQQEFSNM
jgi:hypothetical protein